MSTPQPLLPRQEDIVALLKGEAFLPIEALAARFGVTPQTIRRDVNLLCDLGLARRRHGGITGVANDRNVAYQTRAVTNLAQKRRIAEAAAAEIPDGASLAFGIGTTPEQVALALTGRRNLRVVTNNLNVAFALVDAPGAEVEIPGGRLRPGDRDVVGPAAAAFFARFKVDFGIYGVGGIEADGTLLDFDADEVLAREAIRANCRRALLVADASKFGRNAHARGGHLTEAQGFFTDRPLPPALTRVLEAAGVTVILAEPSSERGGEHASS